MATHLAPDEMLADYACGKSTPGMALLLAAHLTQAPEARRMVRDFERVAGALLAQEPPAEMLEAALDRALAAACSETASEVVDRRDPPATGPLPRPVADRIGTDFDHIPWKLRLPGVWVHELVGFPEDRVALLRARPGASVPQHTHRGTEVTLVMQGSMLDRGVEFVAGDVVVNDADDDHRPQIVGDEICYCLIVQQGRLHFTGPVSRILNLLGQ